MQFGAGLVIFWEQFLVQLFFSSLVQFSAVFLSSLVQFLCSLVLVFGGLVLIFCAICAVFCGDCII